MAQTCSILHICHKPVPYLVPLTSNTELYITDGLAIVRSLSGKNWQDRDKADKVSISFPATPDDKLKCFWGCNEDIRKIYHPEG